MMSSREEKIVQRIVSEIMRNDTWINEDELREYFEIPRHHKCVDGGCHAINCSLFLVEVTGTNVREAIQQFESVVEHIQTFQYTRPERFGRYTIKECILYCDTLKYVRRKYVVRADGYLYSKRNKNRRIKIGNVAEVSVRYSE